MKQKRPYPRVIVSPRAARALAHGHPWVFSEQVLRQEPSDDGRDAENGDVVDVFEENGTWRGAGLLSQQSSIRVRLVTTNANDRVDAAFWERKARWAVDYRMTVMGGRSLPGCEPDTTCCRLLFSEADGFPGLVVDRYEDVLVAQVGTVGMQRLRPVVYPALVRALADVGCTVRGLYERNDAPSRAKEGLRQYKGWYDFKSGGPAPDVLPSGVPLAVPDSTRVVAHENGIAYDLDLENSQKTGFFLDQKYNRRAVRELARGKRVLDCFCHVGPFGLNAAAAGASFVREVDVSRQAIDLAKQNARLNGLDVDGDGNDRMGFTCADVLDYLPALRRDKAFLRQEGGPFDLVVLDPPAFTKSRGTVRQASRGYREINREAMRLLPRGGYLATCSCSHFMTRDLFADAVRNAAREAGVRLRQVEERQQAPDHPIVWGVPETHYLDFFVFQVV